jgi:hypothetical protein
MALDCGTDEERSGSRVAIDKELEFSGWNLVKGAL